MTLDTSILAAPGKVVEAKQPENLCVGCVHLYGNWDHCTEHDQTTTEIKETGSNRHRLITLSCTGFQARPPQ